MEPHDITRRRTALGLTQQQLADAVGVHRITVTRWEAGRVVPLGMALRLLEDTFSRLERQQAQRAARRAAYAARNETEQRHARIGRECPAPLATARAWQTSTG